MNQLNENQVLSIEQILEEKGLSYGPLKEELLDHICCQVEIAMSKGALFHQALQQSLDAFQEDEMQELQKQTLRLLNQNQNFMKKLSIAAFLTFLFFASATWLSQEATPVEPAPPRDSIIQKDPPAISPLKGDVHVSSSFGMRMHPILKVKKQHKGTDFKAPMGTPVYATSDGIVEKVETQEGGYGKFIVIRHDEHYQTLYAQLSEMYVQPGQRVERDDHIGAVGSSGASTAPHLHYEVKKDGVNVDPERYLRP